MSAEPLSPDELRERVASAAYHRANETQVTDVEPGRVVLRIEVQDHHLNPHGVVHGGVIAGLLDSACGIALRTQKPRDLGHRTIQLSVNYLRGASTGPLYGIGRVVHSGRRTGYAEAEVRDADDRLLAKGSATFVNLPDEP